MPKRDYFTDKDNFNTCKSNYLERHKSALLTKKQYEQLTHTEMKEDLGKLLDKPLYVAQAYLIDYSVINKIASFIECLRAL